MMNCLHNRAVLIVAILVLVVTGIGGCGSSGGSTAGGGIGGTGVIASGAITDIGSVHVNGAIYNTDTATFILDDSPGTEAEMRRGMVVRVEGTRDTVTTGTANTVTYEDVVKGPVTSVVTSAQATTLIVLGQTVIVEQDVTYVDDDAGGTTLTLPTFTAGDEVEISGLRETIASGLSVVNGPIRATYIDVKETLLSEYEVKGVVENANPTSFDIAGLQIDFGTQQTNGTLVEVKGTDFNSSTNTLVATSIETRTAGLGETEFDHAEVEGFVNSLDTGLKTLELDGQVVDYSGASFEGGAAGDLNNGVKVETEGSISGGILVADKVEFKESIRIRGNAFDSDTDGSFIIDGLSGLTIFVDPALTEYDGFSSVSADDHVEIRGRQIAGSGAVLATEIRDRGPSDSRVEFQAPATAFVSTPGIDNVTLMEIITVDTTDVPNPFIFRDFDGNSINRSDFYNTLTIGDLVKSKGTLQAGPSVNWEEIEREDE